MLVAEELDADWSLIRVEYSTTDMKFGGQGVGGSDAIRSDWDNLRRIGATARALLVSAAAAEWGVPATECETVAHAVRHGASKRESRFGSLAARAATLTSLATFRSRILPAIASSAHASAGAITTRSYGQPLFGIDVRLPNMKVAAIAKCPVFTAAAEDRCHQSPPVPLRDIVEITGSTPTFLMPGVAVVADSSGRRSKVARHSSCNGKKGPTRTKAT